MLLEQQSLHRFIPWIGLAFFGLVLLGLARLMREVHLHQVLAAFQTLPVSALLSALGLTLLSYLLLTGYDSLALHHLGRRLPYRRVALTSMAAYALSYNISPGLLTGSSVRYRFYSAAGLSSIDIAAIVALNMTGFSLGMALLLAVSLLTQAATLSSVFPLPPELLQAIGLVLLVPLIAYLLWVRFRHTPLHWRNWNFRLPSLRLTMAQLLLSVLDLVLGAAVLYILLPPSPTLLFTTFVGFYVLALIAGMLSQVPGGLGVFEGSLLLLLPALPAHSLIASLLAYHAIYFLLPLAVLGMTAAVYELKPRQRGRQLARAAARLLPSLLAALVFLTGAILLLTGTLPVWIDRLALLQATLPLPILELSHPLSSVLGLALLIIAHGLYQRLDAAYALTLILLAAGIVLALLRGLDYIGAGIAAFVLLALLPSRSLFYRHASLRREPLTPRWSAAVLAVLLGMIWLGGFTYKHVEYSNDLWWHFAFHGNASRFLRASLLACVLAAGFGLLRLLQPARPKPNPPRAEELAQAMSIIETESGDTHGHLALTGDKYLLFGPDRHGFLMYAIQGASWITLGDPIGQGRTELIWSFSELCRQQHSRSVFYQVDAETLPLYVDLGLTTLKLGEEAFVPLAPFSLQGGTRRQLRQTRHQLERAGARFELVPAVRVAELLPALRQVSDDWLATRHTAEKRFSIGFFQPDYLCRLPCALVRMDDRIIAFANVLMSAEHGELSVDLMRHNQAAPRGTMDFLLVELMLWGQREGYRHFNLGLAPLAGLQSHPMAPAWRRAGDLLYRHGEHFYNFEGLRAYKAKFVPQWRPKYLACPGGFDLPLIMLDITTLIGGGLRGVLKS